jgi:arylsulfatase
MAAPWAWSFATPFRWMKQVASHLGGTRNGMAVSWPRRITDRGGIRPQFHHVIDVVPTILEAVGVPEPNMVNGIAQRPIEGVSMLYTFDAANAAAPSRRRTQYFEMFGNRAIYHDGWMASTTPVAPPWDGAAPRPADAMNGFKWELYDLTADPTQANDVAAANPDRLRNMQEIFLMEATRYNVLPLDASGISRMIAQRPGPAAGRRQFTYSAPISGLQANAAPSIINKAYTITAQVTVPQGGGNGVLVTQGGRFGGWALYLQQGRPVFNMNLIDLERIKWEGPAALTPGTHTIVFEWTPEPTGMPFGRGGTGVLRVDGQEVARRAMPKSTPFTFAWDETFDVGLDTGTSVDDGDYQSPNAFTGTINQVTVDLGASTINPESMRLLQEAMRQQQR